MEQTRPALWGLNLALISLMLLFSRGVGTQLRYSIIEEQKEGTMVGNVAKDLGVDLSSLKGRGLRVTSTMEKTLFRINQNDGILYLDRKIDREEICGKVTTCTVNLNLAFENPLEIHYVAVEIVDVNDHTPIFTDKEKRLEIAENAVSGSRLQLQAARDQDSGTNSVQMYKLSHNEHFRIEVKDRGSDQKIPILIVQKPLDRETISSHKLILTAVDGGKPPKSGTMKITVDVLDNNDNQPVFTNESYSVMLTENAPKETTVVQVHASDLDYGSNGEVFYILAHDLDSEIHNLFALNSVTGELVVKGEIDFEQKDQYEIDIQASDKATPPLKADKIVLINIIDVNDNAPKIDITSFSSTIREDSKLGTTVALISVIDLDAGVNGKISCSVSEEIPFKLIQTSQDNIYSLITASVLDREKTSHYEITLNAKDAGQPPLASYKTISVLISDVNDNSPEFLFSPYIFYIMENNVPGVPMFSVSASDYDLNENATITYQIVRNTETENKYSSLLNINSETGEIVALKSFDFEIVKTFQFHVLAKDSGTPSLSSNVTVNVFILDQNDNIPVILYPVSLNGSAEGEEEISRNVNAGHLVTKVRAFDADVGYNGWLLFLMQEVSDHTLFGLDRYTGQIRTLRSFTETDETKHKLVILVKDNGNISLSATATIHFKLVEAKESFRASDYKTAVTDEEETNLTFYLIITLGSVSMLLVISIIVLIVMQCSKPRDKSSSYLQDPTYDGTLCHSIQYRSGDKRYMLVGPRMSVGSTLVAGSNRNTLVVPDRRRRPSEEVSLDMFSNDYTFPHANMSYSHQYLLDFN